MNDSSVTDAEIDAYLDDELDLERRLAVEAHLARTPDATARFMADLRDKTALRLLARLDTPAPAAMLDPSARLARRLSGASLHRFRPAMALMAGVALAVLLPSQAGLRSGESPAYVDDAVLSYETGLLRATMASQIESPNLDLNEIRNSMRISMPRLPDGWTVTDVQVFPSDEGPAVQIMIRADAARNISLFAVKAPSNAPMSPTAVRHGATSVAFWQAGDVSFALTGAESPDVLDRSAEGLVSQLGAAGLMPATF